MNQKLNFHTSLTHIMFMNTTFPAAAVSEGGVACRKGGKFGRLSTVRLPFEAAKAAPNKTNVDDEPCPYFYFNAKSGSMVFTCTSPDCNHTHGYSVIKERTSNAWGATADKKKAEESCACIDVNPALLASLYGEFVKTVRLTGDEDAAASRVFNTCPPLAPKKQRREIVKTVRAMYSD